MVLPSSLLSSPLTAPSPYRSRGGATSGGSTRRRQRPPVVLYLSSRCIYVGVEGKPRVVPYDSVATTTAANDTHTKDMATATAAAAAAYRTWTPILQDLYDTWGQDMKDRPVLVVWPNAYTLDASELDNDMIVPTAWERILLHTIGVPAVCFQPVLAMLPWAWPQLTTLLCVYISATAAATFVHAQGQSLPYTLYTVGRRRRILSPPDDQEPWPLWGPDIPLTHPQNLVTALLQTLLACPMGLRTAAIHNIMVCGDSVQSPDLPVLLGRCIQEILSTGGTTQQDDNVTETMSKTPTTSDDDYKMMRTSMVPVDITTLQPLAAQVGILDTTSRTQADLWPWYGATLYAASPQGETTLPWISK